jgi:hypothetical protein
MTRFLLEKPANFNDIERVILNGEELAIDSTLEKKFGKTDKALTPEEIEEAIKSF